MGLGKSYHRSRVLKALGVDPEVSELPLNDVRAWAYYPKYQFVYDRLELAKYQGILVAPMPVDPGEKNYPVVIKPITNLYGMGHQSSLVRNYQEFKKHWFETGFWSTFLTGRHLSFDLVLDRGEIKWQMCFRGIYIDTIERLMMREEPELSLFSGWMMSPDEDLPPVVTKYIAEKLGDYRGCLNVEVIGDKMIEVHLRIGDSEKIEQPPVLKHLIDFYRGEEWTLGNPRLDKNLVNRVVGDEGDDFKRSFKENSRRCLNKIMDRKKALELFDHGRGCGTELKVDYPPLYLLPIWGEKVIHDKKIRTRIEQVCQVEKINWIEWDHSKRASPSTTKVRVACLICDEYQHGKLVQQMIHEMIKIENSMKDFDKKCHRH